MSYIPPYQSPKSKLPTWLWVIFVLFGFVVACAIGGWFLLIFTLHPVRKAQKEDSIVLASAKNVALGMMMYSGDYDNHYPPLDTGPLVASKLDKYLNDLMPPKFGTGDGVPIKTKAANYVWNFAVSSVNHKEVENESDVWMFRTTEPDQFNQICVGYVDCYAVLVDRANLDRILSIKPNFRNSGH